MIATTCEVIMVSTIIITMYMYLVAKLVPVGYGIMKLQISCIVEDEKVGTDYLEEEICKFDDLVSNPCFITCILLINSFVGAKCRCCSL